jgi:hypothetical protein
MKNLLGVLGLLALGAAIVVGMFAAFGGFSQKAPTASTVVGLKALPEQTNQSALTAAAADIGETVTAGDVSWTVTDAGQESELRKYTFPPESKYGSFITITFTVENLSEQPVTLTGETITLLDSKGNEFRPEPDRNDAFIEPDQNLLFSETGLLEPGETKEGKANFEVLPGSSGFRVHLGDNDTNTSEGTNVDLGF